MSLLSNFFPASLSRVASMTATSLGRPARSAFPTALLLLTSVPLLTSAAPNSTPPPDAAGSVAGHAAIVTLPVDGEAGTNVVLLLDESQDQREPDGWVDQIFTLRTDTNGGDDDNVRLDDIVIDWSRARETVTVRRNSKSIISLTLRQDGNIPVAVVPGAKGVRYGYEVRHHDGLGLRLPSVDRGRLTADERLALTDVLRNAILSDDCIGGGPGASSCSISCKGTHEDCSVNCQAGYYACCDHSVLFGTSCGCVEMATM